MKLKKVSKSQLLDEISAMKWYQVEDDIINLANVTHINVRDKEEVEAEMNAQLDAMSRLSF